ncbi:hypothetical protein Pan258_45870 [Symmachiella dynata]|nr:hypothetical protein Pan258_45870 [Symmachiella dynata]
MPKVRLRRKLARTHLPLVDVPLRTAFVRDDEPTLVVFAVLLGSSGHIDLLARKNLRHLLMTRPPRSSRRFAFATQNVLSCASNDGNDVSSALLGLCSGIRIHPWPGRVIRLTPELSRNKGGEIHCFSEPTPPTRKTMQPLPRRSGASRNGRGLFGRLRARLERDRTCSWLRSEHHQAGAWSRRHLRGFSGNATIRTRY